jgi:hypothetical protein
MSREHPDKSLIALGVRQPWIELILRGTKTVEVRSSATRQRGTIYLYASKKPADIPAAADAAERHEVDLGAVPYGRLLGTIDILAARPCTPADAAAACVPARLLAGKFAWELGNPVRLDEPLPVRFLPYGVWFYPFRRRSG